MIKLKQVNGGVVTSLDDALLYSELYTGSGIISGCTVTLTGNNQLNIADGRGVACGRFFTISGDESVLAQLSTSGTMQGRVLVRIDLSNIQSPISIVTQVAETLPDLVQDDLNAGGDAYEIPLATYQVTETAVSGLTSSPQAAVWELGKKADKGTPTRLLLDTFESGYSPLLGGWDYGYSKDEMGNVWLSLAVKADSGNFPASTVHVCTLPEGYRPVVTIPVVAQALQGVRDVSILVAIQLDGQILFYIPSSEEARPAYGFTAMFRAAQ